MTITASSGELVLAALDELVSRIVALGIPATRYPGDLQPAGVLVGAPTITGPATMGTLGLNVPVYVVADGPNELDWMISTATPIVIALGEMTAEPTLYVSPINPNGLPAYLISVRMNIAQEE